MPDPSPKPRSRWRRVLAVVLGIFAFLALLCVGQFVCLWAVVYPGLLSDECPSGDVLPTLEVNAWSLQRGASGTVVVQPWGWFSTGPADGVERGRLLWGRPALVLVAPDGDETELEPEDGWERSSMGRSAEVILPQVPDGDYVLRAEMDTWLGALTQDVPLPLYAPARGHVLTDRPLYEPGHTVQVRALTLRAADLVPLAQRPGRFEVRDPSGLLVFQEKASTDEWGVASTTFPLERQAESGAWTVAWRSGELRVDQAVTVKPFTLPRFSIEAKGDGRWYEPGETPTVRGTVRFSSGAPVGDAVVQIDWRVDGDWPMPAEWRDGGLPRQAQTGRDGTFSLDLPPVPADLLGQATLVARLTATSPAGDTQTGGVRLLLSDRPVLAEAVTELDGGLVEGFNNRVYVRVTTPDGQPLRGADLSVRRAWDPRDPGIAAEADADGVAALQLDPGPPVNVLVPAQPVRLPPRPDPVARTLARDLLRAGDPVLADQLALDRLLPRLQGCAKYVTDGDQSVRLGLVVEASGVVSSALTTADGLAACLAAAHRGLPLKAGAPRVVRVDYQVTPPDRPALLVSADAALGEPLDLEAQARALAAEARDCLPQSTPAGTMATALRWQVTDDSRQVDMRWVPSGDGGVLSAADRACVERALSGLTLIRPAPSDGAGVLWVRTTQAPTRALARPQPTMMLGYELLVAVSSRDEALGEAPLRLQPGWVPDLRLRADPVLPKAGDTVTVQALRGPEFSGELPEHVYLRTPVGGLMKAELDEDTRAASWTLPDDAQGWYTVTILGAVARIFVAPVAELSVDVTADAAAYAPGSTATLTVTTRAGGAPTPAGLSLVGVDATLGQLAPLPGADALEGLQPEVGTSAPAFGVLDGQALAMGAIQGRNAQAATVLRVSSVPATEQLETPVSASAEGTVDPVLLLTDRFYPVLAALHERVRRWEAEAPDGEQMTPERMAGFWREARAAVEDGGGAPTDAFGRPLRLSRLPRDLLALTDPRRVVVDGTRLPEDVERWDLYVAEEDPR